MIRAADGMLAPERKGKGPVWVLLTLQMEEACVRADGDAAPVEALEPTVVLEPTERPRMRNGVG